MRRRARKTIWDDRYVQNNIKKVLYQCAGDDNKEKEEPNTSALSLSYMTGDHQRGRMNPKPGTLSIHAHNVNAEFKFDEASL